MRAESETPVHVHVAVLCSSDGETQLLVNMPRLGVVRLDLQMQPFQAELLARDVEQCLRRAEKDVAATRLRCHLYKHGLVRNIGWLLRV